MIKKSKLNKVILILFDYTEHTTIVSSRERNVTMTEQNSTETPKKKISLQEAIKQQLENKKKQALSEKQAKHHSHATKQMKSQQTKKQNNQRKRTGV